MINTTLHEQLLQAHAGRHYDTIRAEIQMLDWDGFYPEVDADARITGRVIDASSQEHTICEIIAGIVMPNEHASDAMISDDELHAE